MIQGSLKQNEIAANSMTYQAILIRKVCSITKKRGMIRGTEQKLQEHAQINTIISYIKKVK